MEIKANLEAEDKIEKNYANYHQISKCVIACFPLLKLDAIK